MAKSRRPTRSILPVLHLITADVPITSTPIDALELNLPDAGRYEIDITACMDCGVLTLARNLTVSITPPPGATRVALHRWYHRTSSANPIFVGSTFTTTTSGGAVSMGTSSIRVRYQIAGSVEVKEPKRMYVRLSIADETATLRAGSFARAQLRRS